MNNCGFLVVFVIFGITGSVLAAELDDYIARPESVHSYELLAIHSLNNCSLHVLNLTTLTWMNQSFVNNSVWWHYLTIAFPDYIHYPDAAFFHVGGSSNPRDPPTPSNDGYLNTLCNISVRTGAVGAYLKMIPNQPLYFNSSDPEDAKTEDFILGYTWNLFIEAEVEPVPEINGIYPMVKAAKLAMDTVVAYANTIDSSIQINKYMPSGSSKRGWVSWLLGAVDSRVFAMVPRVLDVLNVMPNLHHHFRSLGGWSWAFLPYYAEGVSRYLNHPRAQRLAELMDPYEFRERITMPKLLISSCSDEFLLPDGSHYFWDDFPGIKYMSMMENTDHGQGGHDSRINTNIVAFFHAALDQNYQWPSFTWQRNETASSGLITVWADPAPNTIKAWWADTTNITHNRRDFRLTINILAIDNPAGTILPITGPNPIVWEETAVADMGDGSYSIELDKRPGEYEFRAFFVQATYDSPEPGSELVITSEVNIIPDIFPFPRCTTEEECGGLLK